MLSYAFEALREQGFKNVELESIDTMKDLCAAILAKGVAVLVKRGLGREYVECEESLVSPRGRISVTDSIKRNYRITHRLECTYDEFSVNSTKNRILRSTMELLVKSNVKLPIRKELMGLLDWFDEVEPIDLHTVNWSMQYDRNNRSYRMLIAVCWLVVKGLLQTQSDGQTKLMDFLDEQKMHKLYEKFILEYYRKHRPDLHAASPRLNWIFDDDTPASTALLPQMQCDIMLHDKTQYLIIDAKYYMKNTVDYFGKTMLHNNNINQICVYTEQKKLELEKQEVHLPVSGMLLYARTDCDTQPDADFTTNGRRILVRTLDLNQDSLKIAQSLDNIATEFFGPTE